MFSLWNHSNILCIGKLSEVMHRLKVCAWDSITQQRRGQVLCQPQLCGLLWLFVCSFHLYPSIQPSLSSHSPIGDSMRECLDSLQLVSLCITNTVSLSIVMSWQCDRTQHKSGDVLTPCVCLCVCKYWQCSRQPDTWREKCLVHIIHRAVFNCADHVSYIQTLHSPHGKQWGVAVVLCSPAQCLQTVIAAKYRNSHAKYKSLLQTISH